MPYLIKTPEQIFRETGKDLYLIRFCEDKAAQAAASSEIQQWITANLPGTRVEPLAPSEYSGWISGYFGDLWVDFSTAGLAKWCARWETAEGKSVDERFQCFLMPYQVWYDKHGRFVPVREEPAGLGVTVWIDTPIGIIYHQLDSEHAGSDLGTTHPANARDLWMHAVRLWPELAQVALDKLDSGEIFRTAGTNGKWIATFDAGFGFTRSNEEIENRKQAVRAWFKIPDNIEMIDSF